METPESFDAPFERAEPEVAPAKPREDELDPETAEAEAIGLTREELLEVRAAQHRLWPLGQ